MVVLILMTMTMTMTMLLMMILTDVPLIVAMVMVVNRSFSTRGSVPPLPCPSQYVPEPRDGHETPNVCQVWHGKEWVIYIIQG